MSNQNGNRSKYDDRKTLDDQSFSIVTHSISKLDDPRRHNPKNPGTASTGVKLSLFTEMATGDWSWKPGRYKSDLGVVIKLGHEIDRTVSLEAQMRTFRGVPPGAAELYGRIHRTT